jgi:uncharacterized secreted protein with C-terminal beta-propeller domain
MFKKAVIFGITSLSLISENINLDIGWNLVGFSKAVTFEELSKNSIVDKTYTFKNNSWVLNGDSLPTDGVWVHSTKLANIYIEENYEINSDISKIELKAGWNLISIPINSAVSPKIFQNQKSIWKYSDGIWSQFRFDETSSEFPQIDILGSGEGFWVYSESDEVLDIAERESVLTTFQSEDEMLDYLKAMVKYNNSTQSNYYFPFYRNEVFDGDIDASAPTFSDDASSEIVDSTTTNTQEVDVDEADIVKNDGDKIFYLSDWESNKIFVTKFSEVLNGNREPLTSIEMEKRPSDFYLIRDKLIVIYPQNSNFWGFWCSIDYGVWSNKSLIEVYDVSDIEDIHKIESFETDGNIVDTRVANGKLYAVNRYMPYLNIEYAKDYESCKNLDYDYWNGCYYSDENGTFSINFDEIVNEEFHIIPTLNGESLITEKSLYAPIKMDQSPFITSIISFDIDDFSKIEKVSIIGNSETLYSSSSAIYLASTDYRRYISWRDYSESTTLFKFSIDSNLSYSGKGEVDGRILNQFSLSEYNDTLRIATTKGRSWWEEEDSTDNMVFALKEINSTLNVVGEIRGLGKANETIRGVRFLGDKGYVVTFLQTDPLYIIDMSNPQDLKKGENPLQIDGYSTYFHPVNSELLLSFGVNADSDGRETGYQLQLFNVADFNNPSLLSKVLLPEEQSADTRWNFYSEAVNDHKAFTYRDSDNLFGVPLRSWNRYYMNEEEKIQYLADEYIHATDLNLSQYEIKEDFYTVLPSVGHIDFKIEGDINITEIISSNFENSSEVYVERVNLESGYLVFIERENITYPLNLSGYLYENNLHLYSVDTETKEILTHNQITGGGSAFYSHHRSILFSTEENESKRDWGLYILDGELYLHEVLK